MAQSTFAQATPHDVAEIPTYVIKPSSNESRYHAPRLARTTLSLAELRDRDSRSLAQRVLTRLRGKDAPAAASELSELRYQATGRHAAVAHQAPVQSERFRWVGRGAAAAALLASAGALGWNMGTQIQPASANSSRLIPASVLIASQNLPLKLPSIEHKATVVGGLEQGHRTNALTYVVRSGDTFTSVATRFGLTPRTVRLVNRLPMGLRLRPGQQLAIAPGDGLSYNSVAGETFDEIAKRYDLTHAALLAANPGVDAAKLPVNQLLFIPGAQALRLAPPKGSETGRGYRTGDRNEGSGNQRVDASRALIGAFGTRVGALSWPAAGQISSPFGIRGYSFHPGMDICAAWGTPVHAAKAGTVIAAGWNGGYGNCIDIDHGGGVVTRYGHCSKLLVATGQKITVGEQIALMGSTGHSTGPHVHFEVRIQGRAVNPASFL